MTEVDGWSKLSFKPRLFLKCRVPLNRKLIKSLNIIGYAKFDVLILYSVVSYHNRDVPDIWHPVTIVIYPVIFAEYPADWLATQLYRQENQIRQTLSNHKIHY